MDALPQLCVWTPVIKEPFTEVINGGCSESCFGGSSHSWLWVIFVSWPAAPVETQASTLPWPINREVCQSAEFPWFGPGGKHPHIEYWAPVEDMTERQGDQRVRENSQEPEDHKLDLCEEPMWLSRADPWSAYASLDIVFLYEIIAFSLYVFNCFIVCMWSSLLCS